MRMSPSLISFRRLTIFIAVVLPPPDGPTRTQISPAGTTRERSLTAAARPPGYRFVTFRKTISAAALSELAAEGKVLLPEALVGAEVSVLGHVGRVPAGGGRSAERLGQTADVMGSAAAAETEIADAGFVRGPGEFRDLVAIAH